MNREPLLTCPCCGYKTIGNYYEICHICAWTYDPNELLPDMVGGANQVSLREAQRNFLEFGAIKLT